MKFNSFFFPTKQVHFFKTNIMNSSNKLVITNYYDSIVNSIDIFIEEHMKDNKNRLIEEETRETCEGLNQIRDEMIKATREVEAQTLAHYEKTIRNELKLDETLKTLEGNDRKEYLHSKLFSYKYAVLLIYYPKYERIFPNLVLLIVNGFYFTKSHLK